MPDSLVDLAWDQLMVDPTQPRKTFDAEEIKRLSESIKARGILMPLRVLWSEERGHYLIVCGESRYRAAKLAGLATVPCVLVEGQPSETELLADRIVENHCRSDLEPIHFAQAIQRLQKLKSCTSQALAAELGLSGAAISRAVALLSLPEEIQARIGKDLSESTAYAISRLETPEQQFDLAEKAIKGGWSRGLVEAEVAKTIPKKKTTGGGAKLALKLTGGIAVSFVGEKPLKWADLLAALERMQAEAKRLSDANKSPAEWAKALAG